MEEKSIIKLDRSGKKVLPNYQNKQIKEKK